MKTWIAIIVIMTFFSDQAGGTERPVITLRGELAHLSIDLAARRLADHTSLFSSKCQATLPALSGLTTTGRKWS